MVRAIRVHASPANRIRRSRRNIILEFPQLGVGQLHFAQMIGKWDALTSTADAWRSVTLPLISCRSLSSNEIAIARRWQASVPRFQQIGSSRERHGLVHRALLCQ